jgi:hypothetical protein
VVRKSGKNDLRSLGNGFVGKRVGVYLVVAMCFCWRGEFHVVRSGGYVLLW